MTSVHPFGTLILGQSVRNDLFLCRTLESVAKRVSGEILEGFWRDYRTGCRVPDSDGFARPRVVRSMTVRSMTSSNDLDI